MYLTDEEIKDKIVSYRKLNGQGNLSPSRLMRKVEDFKRQLGIGRNPADNRDRTAAEALMRIEPRFTESVAGEVVRPHGFHAHLSAYYGNPLHASEGGA